MQLNLADKNTNSFSIDIPQAIRTNSYISYSSVKNYEDTLQKLFTATDRERERDKKSDLIKDPYIFLWKVEKDGINNDLFPDLTNINLDDFGIDIEECKDIVITGPLIRSCISKLDDMPIRQEIYIYKCNDSGWDEIIELDNFEDSQSNIFDLNSILKIYLIKKHKSK